MDDFIIRNIEKQGLLRVIRVETLTVPTMRLREKYEFPVIMLTAKSEEIDKVTGLNIGADDYVTKPFNPLELIARVKSQLRRYTRLNNMTPAAEVKNDEIITIDDLKINVVNHQVFVGDEEKKLTPTEFDILLLLAENRGKVFSIENIYESVWKEDFMESDNTVMVHIRKIREKLGENSRMPKYIKTVWGVGYKIEK